MLELIVRVININKGRNKAIANRCKKLSEYSAFVAKARELMIELGDKEEAIKAAIKYCEEHDILKEFVRKHAAEVLGMLYTEFNLDDAIAVAREEGWEDGMTEANFKIAKNLLSKGSSIEFVHEITGVDFDTLKELQAGL